MVEHVSNAPQLPPKETPKAYQAFLSYCELGTNRSFSKLAASNQKYTKRIPLFKRWSTQHNWQERVKQYDAEREEEKRLKHEANLEEMNERHIELAITQQEKAVQQIADLIEAKAFGSQAVVQLLKLATDLERLARGASTAREEITGNVNHKVVFIVPQKGAKHTNDNDAS